MIKLVTFDESLAALAKIEPASGLGAALAHCAQSIDYSRTGFPTQRGFLVRKLIAPLLLRKYLRQGFMTHDVHAPIPLAPAISPTLPFEEGVAKLRGAMERFRAHAGPLAPHFAFGEISRDDYERLHAMHLADHLSSFAANRS